MKWKTSHKNIHGDKTTRKYFALFPTELDDGYTVWLESYFSEEVWYEYQNDTTMSHWKSVRTFSQKRVKPVIGN